MIGRLTGSLSISIAILGSLQFVQPQPVDSVSHTRLTDFEPTTIAGLAIYVRTLELGSGRVLDAMKMEVDKLLTPLGIPIDWRELDHPYKSAPDLAVLTLHGKCEGTYPSSRPSDEARLGWTWVADGKILPFAELDCDRVRWMIQKELSHTPETLREMPMGRALGRIAAHELYHIFAHTMKHGSYGLTKATISGEGLTENECKFRPQDLRAMRAGLVNVRRVLSLVRGLSDGSAVSGQSIFQENGCSTCHGARAQGTRGGPSLRGRLTALGPGDESIAKELARMYEVNGCKPPAPALDENELGDLISFLKTVE